MRSQYQLGQDVLPSTIIRAHSLRYSSLPLNQIKDIHQSKHAYRIFQLLRERSTHQRLVHSLQHSLAPRPQQVLVLIINMLA